MPAKNRIKPYLEEGYYHIYNRGVNKANIFQDKQDYSVFLSYLKNYLEPKDEAGLLKIIGNPLTTYQERYDADRDLKLDNFFGRINLLAYCLMPNHFHLLIHQKSARDVADFMRSIGVRHTAYMNRRHKRVGPLVQGAYKGVLIKSDDQLLYLTRYIHRNPFSLKGSDPFDQPSSYKNYLGEIYQPWVEPEKVLVHFSKSGLNTYQSFVQDITGDLDESMVAVLPGALIDDEL